jgi:4-hydroxy-3-polyprenylbenzoate decarboxylase
MAMALGVEELDEIQARLRELLTTTPPVTLREKVKMIPRLFGMRKFLPRQVRSGRCKEVIRREDADLGDLPIMKCWPEDGGRFITLPLVITRDPETGIRNVGMYRMQVYDGKTTGMHWQKHKTGTAHYRKYVERNERMPVAVSLGGDPALTYSATAPLPEGVDEILFAGFLRNEPVEMVRCETNDLEVPASSEIVIEGYVDPGETRPEGPFGDHRGYYSLPDEFPVFHVTAITHAADPVYPSTVVGRPPMEDAFLGKATERIFLPLLQMAYPEVLDMNFPVEGVFHNLCIVKIRKAYPGHGRKIISALWGSGQIMFSKFVIVVDEDVDVHNPGLVLWRVGNNVAPERDTFLGKGPIDELDHSSEEPCYGSKMGIDATRKWPEEGLRRPWPDDTVMTPEIKKKIDEMWESFHLESKS